MRKLSIAMVFVAFLAVVTAAPSEAASAQRPARLTMQSIWAPSITLWRPDKYFADLVNVLADGVVHVDYFDGGTLVTTSDELFDAVSTGALDLGSDWPSYWEGKNTVFALFTSVPMIFTPGDYMVWYWQAGGFELAQEMYGKYGMVWLPHSVTSPESGQRTNVPIRRLQDYAGIKMRQCGRNQARILEQLGAAPVFTPGAEIYLSLQRGVLDGAEFSVPEVDWSMGLQEVTKYNVQPGWHQPGPVSGIMINKQSYDRLPDRAKFILKQAAMATMMWSWTFFEYSSGEYTDKFLEAGTTITRLEDDAIAELQAIADRLLIADARANRDHAKVAFSMVQFLKDVQLWRDSQQPYMFGRTPPTLEKLYEELRAIAQQHGVYDDVMTLRERVRARNKAQEFWTPSMPYTGNPVMP
ncbi:ABC transporter substrate-binding protein [Limnochorda pilosa]|uniref:ABC transporter substrate-binding protein n=2 Tax=Limnochorda pilosa TaxID=1555112 RepID=A0A0K2SNM5_LIMPI|nr:ABC transporter substrate-binding protein [Limnochorda pilosa]